MTTLTATIVAMGLVTFAIRLLPLLLLARVNLPPLVTRGLRYVPASVLTAIIAPELLQPINTPAGQWIFLHPANFRLWAGLLAVVIAWRTRNVLLTISGGMALLWLLQWIT